MRSTDLPDDLFVVWGCMRDSRFPGVVFGPESATSYPNVLMRSVTTYNGRSTWGYMLTCAECGGESVATATSSVSYEDAPGRFATEHRHGC